MRTDLDEQERLERAAESAPSTRACRATRSRQVDTLIQHQASISHRMVAEGDRRDVGVTDQLVRVSVGWEDVEDLWHHLNQDLKAV